MAEPRTDELVNFQRFYETYHGHEIKYLEKILRSLQTNAPLERTFVYFAGDSSLDNKYWIHDTSPAINGYEKVIDPPVMICDVAYHLNNVCVENDANICVVNTAVEATTLGERTGWLGGLLSQDEFIRDNIGPNDVLVVSVGGNDIALSPSLSTVANMLSLMYLNSTAEIADNIHGAWGSSHFLEMFGYQTKKYIEELISKNKPKKVIICLIYFPDEATTGSWADTTLGLLGYNSDPGKLQTAISQVFIHATSNIKLLGTEVLPFPMFEVLDGKKSKDYVQRVEPSNKGGRKLAEALFKYIV